MSRIVMEKCDATHEALHTSMQLCHDVSPTMANQVDLLYRLSAHDQLITDYAHNHTLNCDSAAEWTFSSNY